MKGLPKKKLLKQIRIEAVITGLFAAFLSGILGIVLFYGFKGYLFQAIQSVLSGLLGERVNFDGGDMSLVVGWVDFGVLPIFGIIGGLITYIPVLYYIQKYNLSQLLATREARDLPVVYDEISVYEKDVDQKSLDWEEFLQTETNSTKKANTEITHTRMDTQRTSRLHEEEKNGHLEGSMLDKTRFKRIRNNITSKIQRIIAQFRQNRVNRQNRKNHRRQEPKKSPDYDELKREKQSIDPVITATVANLKAASKPSTAKLSNNLDLGSIDSAEPIDPEKKRKISRFFRKFRSNFSRKKKKSQIYEDHIKNFERKIPKFGLFMIILSIIPYILISLFFNSTNGDIQSILQQILQTQSGVAVAVSGAAVLSPTLLIAGIVRFVGIEKPSRFAKIAKWIARPFIQDIDKIFGLKMINSKELIKWIRIFALFLSFFTSMNILSKSVNNYQVIAVNYEIGADLNLELEFADNIQPHQDLNSTLAEIAYNMTNLSHNNGSYINNLIFDQKIFTNVVGSSLNYERIEAHKLNITQYRHIISEDDKTLISPDILPKLQLLEENNQNNPTIPGILISESLRERHPYSYANNETIELIMYFLNWTSSSIEEKTIEFRIIEVLPFSPGLETNYIGSIIFDEISLFSSDCTPVVSEITVLIDVDLDKCPDDVGLQGMISACIPDEMRLKSYSAYNQNWELNNLGIHPEIAIFEIIEMVLYFLAFILAFTLGLLLIAIKKSDAKFYSLLYTRGYGKKGIYKILLAQIVVLFVCGLILGLLGGFLLPSLFLNQIKEIIFANSTSRYIPQSVSSLPLYWDPGQIIIIIGLILSIAVGIYFFSNYLNRQKINQELQKF